MMLLSILLLVAQFISAVRGTKMNAVRNRLIVNVFRSFDRFGEGVVSLDSLANALDCSYFTNQVRKIPQSASFLREVKQDKTEFINFFAHRKVALPRLILQHFNFDWFIC